MSKKKVESWAGWMANIIHKGIVQLHQEDSCTDFVVEIDGRSFPCHKVVLASVSDYFKALFTSGMKETSQNKVALDDVDPNSFQLILNFLYPKDQNNPLEKASDSDVSDLLKLAGRFQMTFLQEVCLGYFKGTMSETNCVERWKFGEQIMCKKLTEMGFGFITENFEEIASANILVSLEFDDFYTVIKNESMHVKREDIVWSAIQKWISFDKENRGEHVAVLLRECCLTEIETEYLVEEICFDPVVRHSDAASVLVLDAYKYKNHYGLHGDVELKFRDCHEKKQTLFVVLENEGLLKCIAVSSSKNWIVDCDSLDDDLRRSVSKNVYVSCCVHGDSVYLLKGDRRLGIELWVYCGSSNSWQSLRLLDVDLTGYTMSAADGVLYVIGGRSTRDMNAQVWQYNMRANSWGIVGEIMAPVTSASSVCVDNKIYIFGGKLENGDPTDCVQVFDTETDMGTIYCNLPKPCSWSRALVRRKTAYVVTSDGDVVNVSLETGKSSILASLPSFDRVNFGISLKRNILSIFGGRKVEDEDEDSNDESDTKTVGKDFKVDINNGEVKASRFLHGAGQYMNCEVYASVLVVLNSTKLTPLCMKK